MDTNREIILASGSPRRRQLLSSLNVAFKVVAPDTDESFDETLAPSEAATHIAQNKALHVAKDYPQNAIIAADTIVVLGNNILGKPRDEHDAFYMLKSLSDSWHEVITGVCIFSGDVVSSFYEKTKVHFKALEDDFISWYIGTKEPMDKAGAYGIQGYGAVLVDKIEGDFYNVMGFPVSRIMSELKKLDIYDIGRG